jgi:hypothetical protein
MRVQKLYLHRLKEANRLLTLKAMNQIFKLKPHIEGAMMLDHLGCPEAASAILGAIESVLQEGPKTPDLGGKANTVDLGKAVAEALK